MKDFSELCDDLKDKVKMVRENKQYVRKIKKRMIEDIIKRDYREASRGRGTYYTVDYFTYMFDDKETARIRTKNKIYEFRRCLCGFKYKLYNTRYKAQRTLNLFGDEK